MSWFDIGASIISGVGSYLGAKKTNKANIAIAREQMAFQERMSSTAYQRSMDDMRKAGLNPILAYKQGGASSPGGAGIPAVDEYGPGSRQAVSTAITLRRQKADIKLIEEQEKKTTQENVLTRLQQKVTEMDFKRKAIEVVTATQAARWKVVEDAYKLKVLQDPDALQAVKINYWGQSINPMTSSAARLRTLLR